LLAKQHEHLAETGSVEDYTVKNKNCSRIFGNLYVSLFASDYENKMKMLEQSCEDTGEAKEARKKKLDYLQKKRTKAKDKGSRT